MLRQCGVPWEMEFCSISSEEDCWLFVSENLLFNAVPVTLENDWINSLGDWFKINHLVMCSVNHDITFFKNIPSKCIEDADAVCFVWWTYNGNREFSVVRNRINIKIPAFLIIYSNHDQINFIWYLGRTAVDSYHACVMTSLAWSIGLISGPRNNWQPAGYLRE